MKSVYVKLGLVCSLLLSTLLTACSDNASEAGARQWDDAWGGVDKSYDEQLYTMREAVIPSFETLQFHDAETGRVMQYNLYKPADYDPEKSYPLVLFMADASTTGKGVKAPLMQGYGGIIWATEAFQRDHPSFVLVPAFDGPDRATNDEGEVSDEVDVARRLLLSVISQYAIDTQRLYTTGQSMGGMISFYFNATYPGLFAASLYVGSQWDSSVLSPLLGQSFMYIVSAADPKASKGMDELAGLFQANNTNFGETIFSARLPVAEQNAAVASLLAAGLSANFIRFTPGTVIPEGSSGGRGGEHMYSFDYAYQLSAARNWLFSQTKADQ